MGYVATGAGLLVFGLLGIAISVWQLKFEPTRDVRDQLQRARLAAAERLLREVTERSGRLALLIHSVRGDRAVGQLPPRRRDPRALPTSSIESNKQENALP